MGTSFLGAFGLRRVGQARVVLWIVGGQHALIRHTLYALSLVVFEGYARRRTEMFHVDDVAVLGIVVGAVEPPIRLATLLEVGIGHLARGAMLVVGSVNAGVEDRASGGAIMAHASEQGESLLQREGEEVRAQFVFSRLFRCPARLDRPRLLLHGTLRRIQLFLRLWFHFR